jgi:hypothetical protein
MSGESGKLKSFKRIMAFGEGWQSPFNPTECRASAAAQLAAAI